MKRLIYLIPLAAIGVIALLLALGLSLTAERKGQNDALPSALIGKPAPSLRLSPMNPSVPGFSEADLGQGRVTIVNFWASWCAPCRIEHPVLMALATRKDIAVFGVVYKDTQEKAEAYLSELGNPFARLVMDPEGRAAIDWGVTAAPETFVVDGKGIIRARFAGALTDDVLAKIIFPAAGL